MPKPLDGVRVADFSHVFAGPFASFYLALLGAEVIKVESPGRGDGMRNYGPDVRYHGMSPNFIAANAGKRGIAIDVKTEEGMDVAHRLIKSCDVVIENFRPGAMKRLGLGYEQAKALKPDIIYCSISGYGQTGPKRDYAAIDNIVQATSGMMGLSEGPGHPAELIGFPIVDTYTATMAAMGIMGAVMQRDKGGGGQFIDAAMLDCSLTLLSAVIVPYMTTKVKRVRTGRGYSNSPGSGLFLAKDGKRISLGVVQDNQFEMLCKEIGREDLLADPRFEGTVARLQNANALVEQFNLEFLKKDADDWEEQLGDVGISCGVVRELGDAVAQPHLKDRGIILPLHVPGLPDNEDIHIVNLGFNYEHDGPGVDTAPPRMGEHSVQILEELGYDAEAREQMVASGAVKQAPPLKS